MQTRRSRGCLMRLWRLAEGKWFSRWWRGANRFFIKANVLFCVPKENQKSTRYFRGAGTDGLRLPASALLPLASCWPLPQQLLPVSAAGGGRRRCKKGASRPFQTPKERSKRKKASRCAKRFFLVSPTCCFAAGVTLLQSVKFSDDVKSSAEP